MRSNALPLALAMLILITLPSASALYADIAIDVGADGTTTIDGTTNVPDLVGESAAYTAKQGERWLLNITTPILDTFVYTVTLPEGAQVTYVLGKNARITTDNGHVEVRGSGTDAPLTLAVQYSINMSQRTGNALTWLPIASAALVLIILWGILRMRRAPKRRDTQGRTNVTHAETKTPTYIEGIPQRQQAIITLLKEAGGTLTQRQVELSMKLPKSSISRNVEALRRRGIIEKAQLGMTNTLVLAEKYR